MIRTLTLLLALVTPLPAQVWQTIGSETDVVTFNQATTYSFGALAGTTTSTKTLCSSVTRNCFKSFTTTGVATVVFNSNFTDPAPGVTKIVQVLQTTTAQTGTTTHNGVKTAWTVPASTIVVTPPPTNMPSGTLIVVGSPVTTCVSGTVVGTMQCNVSVTYKVAP